MYFLIKVINNNLETNERFEQHYLESGVEPTANLQIFIQVSFKKNRKIKIIHVYYYVFFLKVVNQDLETNEEHEHHYLESGVEPTANLSILIQASFKKNLIIKIIHVYYFVFFYKGCQLES